MPWPQTRRLIGTKVPRLDGPEKSTGRARYTFDINRPGMLHAKILRCPYARAHVRRIDVTAAQKLPGLRALYLVARADNVVGDNVPAPPANAAIELYYAGADVVAVACDTEEHCDDVLRAIRVEYDVLPFQVKEEDALRTHAFRRGRIGTAGPGLTTNVGAGTGGGASTGFNDTVFEGLTVHEGTYTIPVICHQCLESHGIVCEWDDKLENLTIWASTQAVPITASVLAQPLGIPAARIRCITHYMGGGFGSKFGNEIENVACAQLARRARAPVKLMLDRAEEVITGGQRPGYSGRIKIGGNKQGDIRAIDADVQGVSGTSGGATAMVPYVYSVPNFRRSCQVIRLNTQKLRAFRAPNHPQNCFLTEQPIDDLAARLNLDPLQLRLRNLPANAMGAANTWPTIRHTLYTQEIDIARKLSQWDKKWHAPGKGAGGPIKHGIGMALHTWGGTGNAGNQVRVTISQDSSVLVQCSTQDLGTANRTVLAIVVAEILGLLVSDITVRIGESPFGNSSPSGGSTTCPSVAPSALAAAQAIRDTLFATIAPRFDVQPADLSIGVGHLVNRANNNAQIPWRQACSRIGNTPISEMRTAVPADVNAQGGVCGVQIAEVRVDTETGVVRCTRVVAVQDCGLIINKLACESQVAGGVIMGVNAALYEERIMDRVTGRQCNPDMEFYKLGGIQDMPDILVHMHDMPQRNVIGIGEPPMISTAAAVANAVFNAIGRRVGTAPFTPERILAALAQK
jgi:xanthine dehydrogenase YagR molybdenum-binding subunit